MELRSAMIARIAFIIFALIISVLVLVNYVGSYPYYIVFSLLFNLLLLMGFDKNRSFFDLFIGIFFWLGFWLKYSYKTAFAGVWADVGNFDVLSGPQHDKVLLVASIAAAALIIASLVRRKFIFSYDRIKQDHFHLGLFEFYVKYRTACISVFIFLMCALPGLNFYFGIYQRGSIPKTFLPFGLNGVMTWLIFFGIASLLTTLLNFEIKLKKKISIFYVAMGMLEVLFSNFSMLSRGVIMNGSSIFFGLNEVFKREKIKGQLKFNLTIIFAGILTMLVLITTVEYIRSIRFYDDRANVQMSVKEIPQMVKYTGVLFLERWVGIEGVMAVSSYDQLGLPLWKEAWAEKFQNSGTSIYDRKIVKSQYSRIDLTNRHFISLPGMTAFIFYLGNYYVLFFLMMAVGLIGGILELFVFRFGGNNFILCSLMSQVVAYRFVHFGYSPGQSYLLFGTIIMNVLIFFFLEKIVWFFPGLHPKK